MAVLTLACTPVPRSSKSQANDAGSQEDVLTEPGDIQADLAPESDDGATELKDTGNGLPDIPIDVGFEVGDGSVGQSCYLDKHCTGDGLCLDWPHGYCTLMNCPALYDCPEGAACVNLGQGTTLCLDQCNSNDSCRDGYGCKVFSSVGGQSVQGCYALNSKLSVAGGPCKEHTDCPGAASCLSVVDEGYCAVINCSADEPCPESTDCVIFNGVPSCLKSCKNTEECMVEGAVKRFCGELLNSQSKPSKVCVPSVPGVGVGQSCTSNIECETKHCRIVATGKCVGLELGCLSNGDCPSSIVCEQAPAYIKGLCSQLCASNLSCSGNSLCIDSGEEEKWCHLPCLGAADDSNCDPALGESCVFGDPLANTTGSGKYACVVFKPGDDGYGCDADIDCKSQHCLGTPGICTSSCTDTLSCAFPATCLTHQGELRCMRRCFSVLDCPSNLKCSTTPNSSNKICVP